MKNSALILWLLLSFAGYYGCSDKPQIHRPSEALPVRVIKAQKETITREISVSGNVEGNRTVKLGFMVGGRISFILSPEGQKVTKNQLVASLDPENYTIAKELADIQAAQAEDEYTRLKGMHDTHSISDGDFAKMGFALQLAHTQQKLHTKNLAETKIFSPISGMLLKKLAEAGEITGSGIPVAVISDINPAKVTAFVPENELHLVKMGQPAKVSISSIDSVFTGKVTEITALADPGARSFPVRIEVNNPGLLMRPGMIAEIILPTAEQENIILLSPELIFNDPNNKTYVFVVDEASKKAFRREISLGKITRNQVEIISGLDENEMIVTDGRHKLSDGMRVIIENQ
jgi:RND family efflux transporter MFP subunit